MTHFSHGNIIKYCNRPFLAEIDRKALEENGGTWHQGKWKGDRASQWRISREAIDLMDTTLIDNINAVVGEGDTLWILGDFTFTRDAKQARSYRDRIACRNVNIIWGNHDNQGMIRDLFNEAHDLVTIAVPGQNSRIVLSHYAMCVWDGSHRGNWQLYGHSHAGAEEWMDKRMPDRRSVDVGVDNAAKILGEYRPFSLSELQTRFNRRLGYALDLNDMVSPDVPKET